MDFVVYDVATLKVLRCGSAVNEEQAKLQALAGESVLLGVVAQEGDLVRNDRVVRQAQQIVKITLMDIKREAASRLKPSDWKMMRALERGGSYLHQVSKQRESIRHASNLLERMKPIPLDYRDDKYWRGNK